MRIALVQQHAGRDRAENLARGLAALTEAARNGAQLAAFAELGFEWFYPQTPAGKDRDALAEPSDGPTVTAVRQKARELGLVVVMNFYEGCGSRRFDASPVIDADGSLLGLTRMVHITDYPCFHEQGYYDPGDHGAPVYDTRAGRIGVAICYDRHFPEYLRALALGGADLVIVPQAGAVAEWPEGLYEAEMRVAAFQNGYFVALCNRVGREECLEFAGESFVCGPDGSVLARAPRGVDTVLYADVELERTADSHARRLFLRQRRPELYRSWPGDPTRVLLRHLTATLAYRAAKVLREAPAEFAEFRIGPRSRAPVQIVAHLGDLIGWAIRLTQGESSWRAEGGRDWHVEVERFFQGLAELDRALASETPLRNPAELLLQGPLADALTHVGQLALLRGAAGAPIRPESYVRAAIVAGQVGLEQPLPGREFEGDASAR